MCILPLTEVHVKPCFFGRTRLDCDHVQDFEILGFSDFEILGFSLSLLKGDFAVPFLRPDEEVGTSDRMVFMPLTVGTRCIRCHW